MARAYKIHGFGFTRFAGSQVGAIKTRMALAEQHGLFKLGIEITEVDIPTSKTELLPFINELAAKADPKKEG